MDETAVLHASNLTSSASIWEIVFSGHEDETLYEEIANSFTHLIGVFASVIGIYVLLLVVIENRKSKEHVIGCIIYGICLFILYAFSTSYHVVGCFFGKDSFYKQSFQTLDHIAIYFMIAGCYTPMTLINLVKNGYTKLGYFVLAVIWTCALAGSAIKLFLGTSNVSPALSNGFYLFMGWFAVLVTKPIINTCPPISLKWQVYSGLSYSGGVLFLIWDSLHFNHAIWHLAVMAGSFFGYISILLAAILHSDLQGNLKSKGSFEIISSFLKKTRDTIVDTVSEVEDFVVRPINGQSSVVKRNTKTKQNK